MFSRLLSRMVKCFIGQSVNKTLQFETYVSHSLAYSMKTGEFSRIVESVVTDQSTRFYSLLFSVYQARPQSLKFLVMNTIPYHTCICASVADQGVQVHPPSKCKKRRNRIEKIVINTGHNVLPLRDEMVLYSMGRCFANQAYQKCQISVFREFSE